ncbi:Hypothetical protein CINCED_3A022897 [Cinara cedri]|uniref:Uncharacterized protein n=1 Tax=Cinara cedri TaxID=506608 RepID=A0A5E4N1V3_9HEMI|nr:Hypothetical protein CINCED_3A022897 [Cinara cedri]
MPPIQLKNSLMVMGLSEELFVSFKENVSSMDQIPSKGSIFRIEQTILALKKIVHVCSQVNDQKIKPDDALAISTDLLLIVGNLFEHLLTIPNNEIISEVERIEQIYKNSMETKEDVETWFQSQVTSFYDE